MRAPAAHFRSLCDTHLALRAQVDRYKGFVLLQAQQNVACHALHSLGRCCNRRNIESNRITLTQEFLSYMLGVRRPTVSVAAGELQKDGPYRVPPRDDYRRTCQCFGVLHECIKAHRA